MYERHGGMVLMVRDKGRDPKESENTVPGAEDTEELTRGEDRYFLTSKAFELCYVEFSRRFHLVHTGIGLPDGVPAVCYANAKEMYLINREPTPSFRLDFASGKKMNKIASIPMKNGTVRGVQGCIGPRYITVVCHDAYGEDVISEGPNAALSAPKVFVMDTLEEEAGWRQIPWEKKGYFMVDVEFPDTEPTIEDIFGLCRVRLRILA